MAKELGSVNTPPDVFQMFNANRTYYFESDISSLPHLPCTLPAPAPPSMPRLHKSFSQPQLQITPSVQPTESGGSSALPHPADSLHIPAAIMASTSYKYPFYRRASNAELTTNQSVETRYQTEPSYNSSQILRSFHQEFRQFGHHNFKSISAPNSPQHLGSSSDDLVELPPSGKLQPRRGSNPRKLSLLREEAEEMKNNTLAVVAEHSSEDKQLRSQSKQSDVMSSVPGDQMDGEVLRERKKLPLMKQMMNWFTTPQKRASVDGKEFNAISPTSF